MLSKILETLWKYEVNQIEDKNVKKLKFLGYTLSKAIIDTHKNKIKINRNSLHSFLELVIYLEKSIPNLRINVKEFLKLLMNRNIRNKISSIAVIVIDPEIKETREAGTIKK